MILNAKCGMLNAKYVETQRRGYRLNKVQSVSCEGYWIIIVFILEKYKGESRKKL